MGILDAWNSSDSVLLTQTQSIAISELPSRDDGSPRSPLEKQLIKTIYFALRLLPTYYILILVALLVVSIRHYLTVKKRQKEIQSRKDAEKSEPPSRSSTSSTLLEENDAVPKDGSLTERTPLVHSDTCDMGNASIIMRMWARLRSLQLYQPQPIPAVTARANNLPSGGISLLVVIFFALNLFYLFYGVPMSSLAVFVVAFRAGLCFVFNLPVLYLLEAKNNQPLKKLTGWSYEKLNIYHRRLGEWMVLLGVIHAANMFAIWYEILRPQGHSLSRFLSSPIIILGVTALLSFLLIWVTSIGYVRERFYELFLVSHVVLQIIALLVLFFHSKIGKPFCGAALVIWALDRVVTRMTLSSKKFIATLEIAEDKKTVLLYCDIPIDKARRFNIRSGWKAGQHVFVSIPGMRWHHAYQTHPFTIASPAPTNVSSGTIWPLQLIIRAQDGFSKDLLEYAEFHQHAEIYIDGPYGDSNLDDAVLSADRVCLIAGGSGITVTYPLAWVLWAMGDDIDITSGRKVYHRGKKSIPKVMLHSVWTNARRAHFWIRQSSDNQSWLTMFPTHHTGVLRSGESNHCDDAINVISQTFETRHREAGRPDVAAEIRAWLAQGNEAGLSRQKRVCLVVSGPDGLVRDVRNCAAALVKEGYSIELHVEKFGW